MGEILNRKVIKGNNWSRQVAKCLRIYSIEQLNIIKERKCMGQTECSLLLIHSDSSQGGVWGQHGIKALKTVSLKFLHWCSAFKPMMFYTNQLQIFVLKLKTPKFLSSAYILIMGMFGDDAYHPFYPIYIQQRIERSGRFRLPRIRTNRNMRFFFQPLSNFIMKILIE